MKMHPEDFDTIKTAIDELLDDDDLDLATEYEFGRFARSANVKDLNKRFRWDLFHKAGLTPFTPFLYKYLNDDHIDTALRHIVPTITRRY